MSNILQIAKEDIRILEKKLLYLYAKANTITEFCLSAKLELENDKNEIQKQALKKILKKMRKTSRILDEILHSNNFEFWE